MKFLRRIVVGVVALAVLAAGAVYAISSYRLSRRYAVRDSVPVILSDSATVERGRHLAFAIAKCADCHGADLGGRLAIDAGPVGQLIAPNLTRGRGGLGGQLSDAQFVTAIRHGVRTDGRSLRMMPASAFNQMSDADVAAIVAYVRSVPPIDRENSATVIRPLGRLLYVVGQLPILSEAEMVPHSGIVRPAVVPGVTVAYGQYLATIGGCTGCHGPGLSGGHVPGTPPSFKPASNLSPTGIGSWSEGDFFRALREGKRPDGTAIDPFMPVQFTALMTDAEIRALLIYLRTVPPRATGTR